MGNLCSSKPRAEDRQELAETGPRSDDETPADAGDSTFSLTTVLLPVLGVMVLLTLLSMVGLFVIATTGEEPYRLFSILAYAWPVIDILNLLFALIALTTLLVLARLAAKGDAQAYPLAGVALLVLAYAMIILNWVTLAFVVLRGLEILGRLGLYLLVGPALLAALFVRVVMIVAPQLLGLPAPTTSVNTAQQLTRIFFAFLLLSVLLSGLGWLVRYP